MLKTHPEQLTKFDLKADEGIFVGYPLSTKAFRVYNLRTKVIMESIHVSFDDKKISGLKDKDDHERLRFENEDLISESVNSDELDPTNSDPTNSDPTNSDEVFSEPLLVNSEGQTPNDQNRDPVEGEQHDTSETF